jgi:iron complex outermembrane receptor protein
VQNAIENAPYPSPCAFGGIYYNPACGAAVIAGALNIKGKTPPAMPKESGSASIAYTFDVPYGTFTPRAEFIFRGTEWERIFNDPTLDRINSYGIVDLNFLYVPNRGNWTAQLTATNIGNVAGIDSKYTDPYGTGQTSVEYIPPFQIIGSVSYKF